MSPALSLCVQVANARFQVSSRNDLTDDAFVEESRGPAAVGLDICRIICERENLSNHQLLRPSDCGEFER